MVKSGAFQVDASKHPGGGYRLLIRGFETELWVEKLADATMVARAELAARLHVPPRKVQIEVKEV